jgi:hypothetical protein
MWKAAILLAAWITVTGPAGQKITVNTAEIVSVRPPTTAGHFDADVRCVIYTTDGKYVAVTEDCTTVDAMLAPG